MKFEREKAPIGVDVDGTVMPFDSTYVLGKRYAVNGAVVSALAAAGRKGVLITIQGGLNWAGQRRANGGVYPTPEMFVERLTCAVSALRDAGVGLAGVRLRVYHPRAERAVIERTARAVRGLLVDALNGVCPWTVYTTERARKPHPLMLAGIAQYWGDSPEDMRAAANARVPYRFVRRFVEGGEFDWSRERAEEDRALFGKVFPALDRRLGNWLLLPDGRITGPAVPAGLRLAAENWKAVIGKPPVGGGKGEKGSE